MRWIPVEFIRLTYQNDNYKLVNSLKLYFRLIGVFIEDNNLDIDRSYLEKQISILNIEEIKSGKRSTYDVDIYIIRDIDDIRKYQNITKDSVIIVYNCKNIDIHDIQFQKIVYYDESNTKQLLKDLLNKMIADKEDIQELEKIINISIEYEKLYFSGLNCIGINDKDLRKKKNNYNVDFLRYLIAERCKVEDCEYAHYAFLNAIVDLEYGNSLDDFTSLWSQKSLESYLDRIQYKNKNLKYNSLILRGKIAENIDHRIVSAQDYYIKGHNEIYTYNFEPFYLKGRYYEDYEADTKLYEKCKRYFIRALIENPYDYKTWYELGKVYYRDRNYDKAVQSLLCNGYILLGKYEQNVINMEEILYLWKSLKLCAFIGRYDLSNYRIAGECSGWLMYIYDNLGQSLCFDYFDKLEEKEKFVNSIRCLLSYNEVKEILESVEIFTERTFYGGKVFTKK